MINLVGKGFLILLMIFVDNFYQDNLRWLCQNIANLMYYIVLIILSIFSGKYEGEAQYEDDENC